MPRLFIAVWPPEDVIDALRALPRDDRPDLRWTPPENWHVTLRFLGEANPDSVAARLDAARLPAATAVLGPRISRLGRGHIVVPVAGVDDLATAVADASADIGRAPDGRPFSGHLTIARSREREGSGRGFTVLHGHRIDGDFTVRDVTLVQSTTRPEGARYEVIGRFPVT
jgi:2'-5' RNA ligase